MEKYLKHRYQDFNHPIGSLTEYYKFDDIDNAKAALRDLRRMKPKVLSPPEIHLLEDKLTQVEQAVQAIQKAQERWSLREPPRASLSIQQGMQKAASVGVHIGRPAIAESEEALR